MRKWIPDSSSGIVAETSGERGSEELTVGADAIADEEYITLSNSTLFE